MGNKIHIVLALGNESMSDTFVEIEDGNGNAIDIGDRVPRGDGTYALVLDDPRVLTTLHARIAELEADNEELIQAGRRVIDTVGSRESFFYLRQILDDAAMEDEK